MSVEDMVHYCKRHKQLVYYCKVQALRDYGHEQYPDCEWDMVPRGEVFDVRGNKTVR